MSFSVSTRDARLVQTDLAVERSRSRGPRGELEFEAEVAPGVIVTWDPATPRQCVAVAVDADAESGEGVAPERLAGRSDVADRGPWLRLAALIMLDHRLYLPLNRALLDAEIAAAQVGAAHTLSPAEPIRDHLVDRALVRARRAARGVVQYMDRLATTGRRPPPPLLAALDALAGGYATLCAEVDDYDATLVVVTEAADRLTAVRAAPARTRRRVPSPGPSPSGVAQIDPRLVPARVLRLGPTVDSAEIEVVPVPDHPALRVQVPAFEPLPGRADLPDVGVRLRHRRSGRVLGYGLLGLLDRFGERCFEGVVSLPRTLRVDDVQVELHDAAEPAPAASSDDGDLQRARRATLFLAGWRALVAEVRVSGADATPAAWLRAVVRTLALDADRDTDEPLWAGGPASSHLGRIVELGDRTLTALLRGGAGSPATSIPGDDGGAAAVVDSVTGPGRLLAAELAAAYERAMTA